MPLGTHRPPIQPPPPAPEVTVHHKDDRILNFYAVDWWVRVLLMLILLFLVAIFGVELSYGQQASVQPSGVYWWSTVPEWTPTSAANPFPITCISGCSGSGGGTSSNFNATFPTAGTAIGGEYNGNMVPFNIDSLGNLFVNLATALPAGSNTIGAVTQASGPWTVNLTQLDSTNLGAPSNYGTSPGAVAVQGVNADVTNTVATNQTEIGGSTLVCDPCQCNAKSYFSSSGTASVQIVTGSSGKHTYFCSWNDMNGGTAQNYAVVEGTGSTCGSSTATVSGLSGGTTAAGGWNMAANQGRVYGNGGFAVAEAANATGDNVCVLISGSTQINFNGSYVQQ